MKFSAKDITALEAAKQDEWDMQHPRFSNAWQEDAKKTLRYRPWRLWDWGLIGLWLTLFAMIGLAFYLSFSGTVPAW